MQLNTRQVRIFTLANLLGTGKPVPAADIITSLECSEPTLTRALKALREDYSAEIKYSKASHSYQMIAPGNLDKKTLRRMSDDLAKNAELKSTESGGRVILDKEKNSGLFISAYESIAEDRQACGYGRSLKKRSRGKNNGTCD